MRLRIYITGVFIVVTGLSAWGGNGDTTLILKKTLRGGLSPKSVVHNGNGLFFAQNMMYNHTISVYDQHYNLRKTISDRVKLSEFGYADKNGTYRGAPVECAFSPDGKYAYVSNYFMEGEGYSNPGCDECYGKDFDESYIYKINTTSLAIESVFPAGSVPKYVSVTPDGKKLLVSNWSSGDISIIDLNTEKLIKKVNAGRFPRGISIDSESKYAYIAIMGSTIIKRLNLTDYSSEKFCDIGKGPRHLCIDSKDSVLYVSLNSDGDIAAIRIKDRAVRKLHIGGTPRSMTIGNDDRYLYVVNYSSAQITKVDLKSFSVVEKAETAKNPIGITYDERNNEVWVACYSGCLMVYEDLDQPETKYTLAEYFNFGPAVDDLFSGITRIFPDKTAASNPASGSENILKSSTTVALKTEKKKEAEAKEIKEVKTEKVIVSSGGNYFAITGSFKNEANAKRQVDNLKKKGYACEVIDNSNGFHYAAVGGFNSKEEATEALSTLKSKENLEAWVWQKK